MKFLYIDKVIYTAGLFCLFPCFLFLHTFEFCNDGKILKMSLYKMDFTLPFLFVLSVCAHVCICVCVCLSVSTEALKSQLDQGEEKTSKMKQLLVKTKKDLADAKKQVCSVCVCPTGFPITVCNIAA